MNLKSVNKILFCGLFLFIFQSCEVFEIHPYSGKIVGERDINAKNILRIEEETAGKDTIKYAFISDSQRWYDELDDFVKHINTVNNIDFVIHGGDVSDFGLTKEMLWQRDILEKINVPYVVIIGNHDYLANGDEVFNKVFGPLNFSFIAGNTKFVCLNTNALESNYSVSIPDFSFLKTESTLDTGEYKNTVVSMHAKPTSEQFNNNVSELFQYSIKQFPNLLYCANGHNHSYSVEDIFKDGINYYQTPNIGKRQYILFTITNDTYTHELITY